MINYRRRRRFFCLPQPGDTRGSLPMLMLVMLVGVMLGALLVPMLITQNRSSRFDMSRVHALDAAQAGMDAALGQIRAALASDGSGDSARLPCASQKTTPPTPPITGHPNSDGPDGYGRAAYSVYIDYYTGGTAALPTGLMKICAPGYGPYDGNNTVTPTFARLTSTGTDGPSTRGSSAGRTLMGTYVFETSNANISGGTIRSYPADKDTTNWCLDVGAAIPSVGTPVTLQQCSTSVPIAPQQKFAYRSDLTIQLTSSAVPSAARRGLSNGASISTGPSRRRRRPAPIPGPSRTCA
jgi:type II secretory pathway pseudopilin PulG